MNAKSISMASGVKGEKTRASVRMKRLVQSKWVRLALLGICVGFLQMGCAVYPDYSGYYGDYGYVGGGPWDFGDYGDFVVGGYHHHGHFGGHHISHDFGRGFHGGGFHGGGFHGGGGHGGHR
jgi:hypothetical protein